MKTVGILLWLIVLPLTMVAQDYDLQEAKQAFERGEYPQAISLLENSLRRDSLQMQAYQLLGSSYLAMQQPVLAEQVAKDGLRYFPGMYSLQWIEAEALLQQGRLNEALDSYLRLSRSDSPIPKDKIKLRLGMIYREKGGQYYREQKLNLAKEYFLKSKAEMPDSLSSYSNLALVYLRQKNWSKALSTTEEGLKRFPTDTDLTKIRASALYQTKDYEGVITEYAKLYEQNPNDLDTALTYAQMLLGDGQAEKASGIYEDLINKYPNEKRIYESLVEYYDQRHDLKAKLGALKKMRNQFPDDVKILKRIAKTYEDDENWTNARAVYDTVQTMEGFSKHLALARAKTFRKQDSLEAALQIYDQSLNRYPSDKELLWLKGNVQESLNHLRGAEKTYAQLTVFSDSSRDYSRLAELQMQLGKEQESVTNLKKAIARGSKEPNTYLYVARFHLTGDTEKAFNLGAKSLKYSLNNLQEQQQLLSEKLTGNGNLQALKKAEESAKEIKQNNKWAEESFVFMTSNFSQKKVVPLLQSLQEEYPNSGRLLFMMSSYYMENRLQEKGIQLLKESVLLSPNLAEAHLALGKHYEASGQTIPAITSYERASSADPENGSSYKALIRLYRSRGQLNQLCNRWQAQYRANKQNETLKGYLIEALHKAGRFEEAQKLIDSQ